MTAINGFGFKSDLNIIEAGKKYFPVIPQTEEVVMKRTEYSMKAYIISMVNDHESTIATRRLITSMEESKSNLEIFISNAVIPRTIDLNIRRMFNVKPYKQISWTWPKKPSENRYDMATGLKLSCYDSGEGPFHPRLACMLSHYNLWKLCADTNETIMILEHDAKFTREFDYKEIAGQFTGDILGLNDPSRATRKASLFNDVAMRAHIDGSKYTVSDVPAIDGWEVPQGLAGNSAYIIKPAGASKLMALVAENGFWPNDAIMCKQLLPSKIQIITPYFTKVQGINSTTTT